MFGVIYKGHNEHVEEWHEWWQSLLY
jgi:hypothetical protein